MEKESCVDKRISGRECARCLGTMIEAENQRICRDCMLQNFNENNPSLVYRNPNESIKRVSKEQMRSFSEMSCRVLPERYDFKHVVSKEKLVGHSGSVTSVLQLNDGRIASSSTDSSIKVWNIHSGECELTLRGHTGGVNSLQEYRDGGIITGSEDKSLRFWNIQTMECTSILNNGSEVYMFALLSNGNVAAPSRDGIIRIWNPSTQVIEQWLGGHAKRVWQVMELQDGRLASSSNDRTVKIWNLETGRCDAVLSGHTDLVKEICQLEDGRLITSVEGVSLKIWDLSTYECEKELNVSQSFVNSVKQLSKSQILVTAGRVKIISLATGEAQKKLDEHSKDINTVAVLQEGGFATASDDKTIIIWK